MIPNLIGGHHGTEAYQYEQKRRNSHNTVSKYLKEDPVAPVAVETVAPFSWDDAIADHEVKGTPLLVLCEEFKENDKMPWSYSYFWKQFQKRCSSSRLVTMIPHHPPGEKVEIDYADGIDILDPVSGELVKTHLFVGALCNSR